MDECLCADDPCYYGYGKDLFEGQQFSLPPFLRDFFPSLLFSPSHFVCHRIFRAENAPSLRTSDSAYGLFIFYEYASAF